MAQTPSHSQVPDSTDVDVVPIIPPPPPPPPVEPPSPLEKILDAVRDHLSMIEKDAREFARNYDIPHERIATYLSTVNGESYTVLADEYNAFKHAYGAAIILAEVSAQVESNGLDLPEPIANSLRKVMEAGGKYFPEQAARTSMVMEHLNEALEYWDGKQYSEADLNADMYNSYVGFKVGIAYVEQALQDGTLEEKVQSGAYKGDLAQMLAAVYSEELCIGQGLDGLKLIKDSENPRELHYDKTIGETLVYEGIEQLDNLHVLLNATGQALQDIKDTAAQWVEEIGNVPEFSPPMATPTTAPDNAPFKGK